MLRISTKFQALHIQRGLIGDLGVLFDNVRGGIVTVRRSAIDAVRNGNVIVDQIRGDGLPLSIEDRIFRYSNRFFNLVFARLLRIPASEDIALQRGNHFAHRGVPVRQVIRRIGDRNTCRHTVRPIGVIGQLIDIDLAVQVPGLRAKFHIIGRAVFLMRGTPGFDQAQVEPGVRIVASEAGSCNPFVAKFFR